MSKGVVLISGVNGYIAAVVAKHLLDTGFSVRGTVRKISSATSLVEGPLKPYAENGAFTIVEVPDITVEGAFDEAVKGVTAIAHLASPVSFYFTDPEPIIRTAVHGTQTMLNSALKAGPQLKSFIYLSSIAAVRNATPPPYVFTEKDWNNVAEAKVAELGTDTPGPMIYAASKTAAEKAFWAFREKKPGFTMTTLNPVFVIGPPLIVPKKPEAVGETILPVWTVFSGAPHPSMPLAGLGQVVDVRDVASLVSSVLSHPQETDGERYIASSAFSVPQSLADVLRKAFPDAAGRIVGGTPGQGYRPDYQVDGSELTQSVDSSKAKKLLEGGEWVPYEKSVEDTAKSFAGLL